MDERSALLAFNLTAGLGPQRVRTLINYCGSAQAAWHATSADWQAAGIDRRSIQAWQTARVSLDLAAEWAAIEAAGISVVIEGDAAYPPQLASMVHAPLLLYMRGALHTCDRWALAVVGTRNPTPYGREVAYQIASELAHAGITVVSGLALGIDAQAHQAALASGGRTIAVLGSGLRSIYPQQHTRLAEQIATQGVLFSEYAPTMVPVSGNFPARNRLISALALGVLVVEAGARSGALITAKFALDQGRDVFAVPGSILSRTSDGPNQLIYDGAVPVRSVDDILSQLQLDTIHVQQTVSEIVPETPAEALLLPWLVGEPQHIDALCRASGLGAADTAATLGMMELKGMVRQPSPMHYVLARPSLHRRKY